MTVQDIIQYEHSLLVLQMTFW